MLASRRRSLRNRLIALLGGAALAGGCAQLPSIEPTGVEGGLDLPDGGRGGPPIQFPDARVDAPDKPEAGSLNPLCGVASFCGPGGTPDSPNACADRGDGGPAKPDATAPADAAPDDLDGAPRADAADGDASTGPDGGMEGGVVPVDGGARDGSPDAGRDGSSSGNPSAPEAAPYDGPAHSPGLPEPSIVDAGPAFACQVTRSDNPGDPPVRRCAQAGSGATGAPCASPSDCRAGFACVGTEGTGHCLPYCCIESTCESVSGNSSRGMYCGQKPLLGSGGDQGPLFVPVCLPVEDCDLLRDYPCEGPDCPCSEGTACMVVRDDGTTGCRKPGTGRSGAVCNDVDQPCASGYFCSKGSSLCLKICRTSPEDTTCAPGHCHASPAVPKGYGLCAEEAAQRVK